MLNATPSPENASIPLSPLAEPESWNPRPRFCAESELIACPFCRDEGLDDCPLCCDSKLIDPAPNFIDLYVLSLLWGQSDDDGYVRVSNDELAERLGWEASPSVFYLMARGVIVLGYLEGHPSNRRDYWKFAEKLPFEKRPEIWNELVRDDAASLATMPYQDYLRTDHWKAVASAAKERSGRRCSLCNSKGELHAHHRTYERRGAELETDVIALCARCHRKFHGIEG